MNATKNCLHKWTAPSDNSDAERKCDRCGVFLLPYIEATRRDLGIEFAELPAVNDKRITS